MFLFRFYVFSQLKIDRIIVFIDENTLCENARNIAESFYVCAWNPSNFKTGIHHMKILVEVRRPYFFSVIFNYV